MKTMADVLAAMHVLSVKYPALDVWFKVQNGKIQVAIPKGPEGDRFTEEWQALNITQVSSVLR